jgi:predicted  nucleic acid-binding Zn-ribbon protein
MRNGADMDELQDVLRPIASLINKSEKASQKLAPGMWQHTMLRDNIKALQLAFALLNQERDAQEADATPMFSQNDLNEALRAFASMISKTEKSLAKFSPGTSQHIACLAV